MVNKNNNLPDRLVKGGIKRSQEAKVPIASGGAGNVGTNSNIRWTRRKAIMATTLLGFPFSLATVLIFKSGSILIGCVFVGIAVFVGLMYLTMRYMDKNDF